MFDILVGFAVLCAVIFAVAMLLVKAHEYQYDPDCFHYERNRKHAAFKCDKWRAAEKLRKEGIR